jgi:hypothetical protein
VPATLEFHPEAELELLEAALRYDSEVPGLGERFGAEIKRVTDLLLEYPEHRASIGKEVGSGRRKFSLHRFPFAMDRRGIAGSWGMFGIRVISGHKNTANDCGAGKTIACALTQICVRS